MYTRVRVPRVRTGHDDVVSSRSTVRPAYMKSYTHASELSSRVTPTLVNVRWMVGCGVSLSLM